MNIDLLSFFTGVVVAYLVIVTIGLVKKYVYIGG